MSYSPGYLQSSGAGKARHTAEERSRGRWAHALGTGGERENEGECEPLRIHWVLGLKGFYLVLKGRHFRGCLRGGSQ